MSVLSSQVHALIIAGGSGTRFWPLSRQGRPKQLLKFWDNRTLLEHTVQRLFEKITSFVWIVTTEALIPASKEALGQDLTSKVKFLGEPQGKNTAACIYWGLEEIAKIDPQALVAVMPADHYIGDEPAFQEALKLALQRAAHFPEILTLGIKPNRPETGYGYIELGNPLDNGISQVTRFVEKPDVLTARRYVSSGKYLWNAGMFIFQAAVAHEAFQRCMPSLVESFSKYKGHIQDVYEHLLPDDAVSIDYGVIETAPEKGIKISVVPVDCQWNDLGSYTALEEIDKTVQGTVVSHDAASNIVISDQGLVALLGVNDLVVVRHGDVTLVAAKDRCQDIRKIVDRVKKGYKDFA